MTFTTTPAPGPAFLPKRTRASGALLGGRIFFWIAGLSLINYFLTFAITILLRANGGMVTTSRFSFLLLSFFGPNIRFPVWLGITHFMDIVATYFLAGRSGFGWVLSLIFVLLAAGIFGLFGWLTGKGHKAALVIGIILYGIDGLLCLLFGGWFAVIFHAFILFKLIRAVRNFS